MSLFNYDLTRFEVHHLLPYRVFQNPDIRALFHEAGITQEMKGNLSPPAAARLNGRIRHGLNVGFSSGRMHGPQLRRISAFRPSCRRAASSCTRRQ
ncbi:hypothetical protein [Nioella halotolerans]|uniref:hypothetical protein n=1 Tax=Nioella halotolerans TaxID=2303578 RepID=UPI003F660BDC